MALSEETKDLLTVRFHEPEGRDLWRRVTREAQMYSTPLFGESGTGADTVLRFAGSGTYLFVGDGSYVLTAAHVWHEILKGYERIGFGLRENEVHAFFVATEHIATHELPHSADWGEWGPDLILLHIPELHASHIRAFKPFYRLGVSRSNFPVPDSEVIEVYALVGAPEELGTITTKLVSLDFLALPTDPPIKHEHDDFDFLDVEARLPQPSAVRSFGGLSGGGLWRLMVFDKPNGGGIEWAARLEGIIFYELGTAGGSGTIRCHGRRSIEQLLVQIERG